jgi:anti-sigma factor RsiW
MKYEDTHLSDRQLLLSIEGELAPGEEKLVPAHLDACRKCRARGKELEDTIAEFVRAYQNELDGKVPPIAGQRALLKTRLAQLPAGEPSRSGSIQVPRRV